MAPTTTPTIVCAIEETTVDAVVRTGGEMAAALSARLVLAHICRDPRVFNSRADRERVRHRSGRRGQEMVRRARTLLPNDLEVQERVEFGLVEEELTAIADEAEAAFIVVGSRRPGAIAAALLGSVSRTLVGAAPCPVLIVRGTAARLRQDREGGLASGSTVIVGVDGSERSVKATALAGEIAGRLGDRLLLVHAREALSAIPALAGGALEGVSTPAVLTEALAHAGDDAAVLVENGPPAYILQGVAATEKARLIVIGAGRSGGLHALLGDSVTEQLLGLAPCPVLVVPERASATLEAAPALTARRAA